MEPSEILAQVHSERTRDRTLVGQWVAKLTPAERERFDGFVDAFEDAAAYKLPVLLDALDADEVLGSEGAGWPDHSGDSLKKWMQRRERASETR